jgi:uncharacterized membrane protein YbhN (UPF0104 family)
VRIHPADLARRPRLVVALQLAAVAIFLGFLAYALRDGLSDALPRLRHADRGDVGIALALLTAYYLLFVVGWQWILAAMGIRIGYGLALQAEMASMLAKYVPGTVWTPLARILWLRRVGGVTATSYVLSSILLEGGLSALAGVAVFVGGLLWVESVDAPILPLAVFAVLVALLLHPRMFRLLARVIFSRFGAPEPPPLRWRTLLALLAFYCGTWLVGGTALFFLLRAVGGEPDAATIPYLGGTAAVGAIVAVLSVVTPSGLGVREASMYGLLLAVTGEGVALGATVLNRIAITLVEAVLLGAGVATWGRRRAAMASEEPG